MALTPAMEDYLEAILMIKQQHGYVRCVDIAVYKPMEIHPLGPCVIIDTAGFDDDSELGERRVEKTPVV